MKIAWLSNPPFTFSGYAVQSKYFLKRLQRDGHQVVAVCNRLIDEGPAVTIDGIYCFPGGRGQWFDDTFHWGWRGFLTTVDKWKPDIAFSLFDIWTFPTDLGAEIEKMGSIWTPIVPVDHNPIPPAVYARIKDLKFPIAMSKFGLQKMKEAGCETPRYIPHGVDTQLFRPYPMNPVLKDAMGGKDKFIIGIVAANRAYIDRKGWKQSLEAVGIFQQKHEDCHLYIHAIDNTLEGGFDLNRIARMYACRFNVPDMWQMIEGYPDFKMVEIYNNMDVMLLASRGEGFGIPLIEAQACGVPVITTRFSANKELCASQWFVEPKMKTLTEQFAYQVIPDVDSIVANLENAYRLWKAKKMSMKKQEARKFAMQYDIEKIYDNYMIPFLNEVELYNISKAKTNGKKKIRSNKSNKATTGS